MKEDQFQLLSLFAQPPARLTVEQTAWVLNCQTHDIPVLVAARLLRPLGSPPRNGTKYFASSEVIELAKDRSWLAKATNAMHQHWHTKNVRKNGRWGYTDDASDSQEPPLLNLPDA